MSKRNYTHIKKSVPTIQAMMEGGMTQGVLYLSMIRDLYDNAMAENFFSILKQSAFTGTNREHFLKHST